jgi:hypothetical protein
VSGLVLSVLEESVDFEMHSVPFWEELAHQKVIFYIKED